MLRSRSARKSNQDRQMRRRLFLETLESRALLAGDVTVTLLGGTATLTGDGDANSIVITADATTPGRVTISSSIDDATTINGGTDPVTVDITGDLVVNLDGGNDAVEIVGNNTGGAVLPRDLKINLGDGDNELDASGGYAITRDVHYTAGLGFDDVNISDASARDLILVYGAGSSTTRINRLTTVRDFKLTAGDVQTEVRVYQGTVGGDLTVTTGVGNSSIYLGESDEPTLTVGGTATITVGDGDATVSIENLSIALDLILQAGAAITQSNFYLGGGDKVTAGRDVKFTSGPGFEQVVAAAVEARDLILNMGDGGTDLAFSGVDLARNLKVTTGNDAGLENRVAIANSAVLGSAFLSYGDGSSETRVDNGDIFLNLAITQTTGNAALKLGEFSPATIHGNVTLTGLNADSNYNSFDVTGGLIEGNLSVVGGEVANILTLNALNLGGNLNVSHPSQSANFMLMDGEIGGNVVINQGHPTLEGSTSTFLFAGNIGGDVTIGTTSGSNVVQMGNVAALNVAGSVKVTTGDVYGLVGILEAAIGGNLTVATGVGTSTVIVGVHERPETTVGGTAKITTGDGDANVILDNLATTLDLVVQTAAPVTLNTVEFGQVVGVSAGRDIKFTGGSGRDEVRALLLNARDLIFNQGDGSSLLDIDDVSASRNLNITHGADGGELQDVLVTNAAVGGNLNLTTADGTGNIALQMDGANVVGDVRLVRGNGNASYNLGELPVSTIGGDLFVEGGDGSTVLIFSGGSVGGTLTSRSTVPNSGANVTILQSATVTGNVTVNSLAQSNHFSTFGGSFGGNISIAHGSGSSSVLIYDDQIVGNVSVHAGVGSSNFSLGSESASAVAIGGNVQVISDGLFFGSSIPHAVIGGNLTIQTGGNLSEDNFTNVSLGSETTTTTIGGTARITVASGGTYITSDNTTTTLDLIVQNGTTLAENFVLMGTLAPVSVGRDLKVTGGAGNDEIDILNVTARDVIFSLGDGASDVDIDDVTARDLIVTMGTDGGEIIEDVLVGNDLLVDIAGANLTRNLKVTSGDVVGSMNLRIQASEIDVDLILTHGNGSNALNLGDTDAVGPEAEIEVGGNLKINTGAGGNFVNLVGGTLGGSLTDTSGDGANVVNVTRTEILGSLTINSAAPSSLLFLTEQNIHGNLTANHGSGSSFVMMQAGHVGGNATLNSGIGSNNVMIGAIEMDPTTIGGKLTVASAGLYGGLNLTNTAVTGNVVVTNGPGFSDTTLGGSSEGAVTIGGTVRVTNANGESGVVFANYLSVTADFIVDNGPASSSGSNGVILGTSGAVSIGRDLIVRQGNGQAQTYVWQVQVGRNLLLTTLEGNDYISLDGATVTGNTTIDTGAGEDYVTLGESQTTDLSQGTVTVRTGAANDNLVVGSFTVLTFAPTPKFLFNGGAETDTIDIDFAITPAIFAKIQNFEFII